MLFHLKQNHTMLRWSHSWLANLLATFSARICEEDVYPPLLQSQCSEQFP